MYYNTRGRQKNASQIQGKEEKQMKAYFNNLVATRVMDLSENRAKSAARRARRTARRARRTAE